MTRTHDLLITNQLLYRLSYISLFSSEQVVFYHNFSRASTGIFSGGGRHHAAVFVYYKLYFDGFPAKWFVVFPALSPCFSQFGQLISVISADFTGRKFDLIWHFSSACPEVFWFSRRKFLYIIFSIIFIYQELFTFSTGFSTFPYSLYSNDFIYNCIFFPGPLSGISTGWKVRFYFT